MKRPIPSPPTLRLELQTIAEDAVEGPVADFTRFASINGTVIPVCFQHWMEAYSHKTVPAWLLDDACDRPCQKCVEATKQNGGAL